MKFKDMKYERPDIEAVKAELKGLIEGLNNAETYEEAREIFLKEEELSRHIETMFNLVHIRHSIDTRDEFYDKENDFIDAAGPELAEYAQGFTKAMLASKFRPDFEKEYGELMFINSEISERTFKPELIPYLKQENELTSKYAKLIASAQIPFQGKVSRLLMRNHSGSRLSDDHGPFQDGNGCFVNRFLPRLWQGRSRYFGRQDEDRPRPFSNPRGYNWHCRDGWRWWMLP